MRYITVRALVDLPELPLGTEGTFIETPRLDAMVRKGLLALVDLKEPAFTAVPEPDPAPALVLAPEPEPEIEAELPDDEDDVTDDD